MKKIKYTIKRNRNKKRITVKVGGNNINNSIEKCVKRTYNKRKVSQSMGINKRCSCEVTLKYYKLVRDYIEYNDTYRDFSNSVTDDGLFMNRLKFKDGKMNIYLTSQSIKTFYELLDNIPENYLIDKKCNFWRGLITETPLFGDDDKMFLPLPISTAPTVDDVMNIVYRSGTGGEGNYFTLLKIKIKDKYLPIAEFENLLSPGHLIMKKRKIIPNNLAKSFTKNNENINSDTIFEIIECEHQSMDYDTLKDTYEDMISKNNINIYKINPEDYYSDMYIHKYKTKGSVNDM